jgi:uncharacterized protein (DUF58 family)
MSAKGLSLTQRWHSRWTTWWEARLPRKDTLTLTQRNLYILPTRAGWSLGGVFIVLLLASINEQLNLGYALSFTLGGAALAAMHQTHGNLQGISLGLLALRSVHAGEVIRVGVRLSHTHPKRGRLGLQLRAGEHPPVDAELLPRSEAQIELDVPASTRGWLALPRITLDSRFPLGIFRAWAYWRPAARVLIWPALDLNAPALPDEGVTEQRLSTTHMSLRPSESPEGLRGYRRGDPLKLIAWKKSSQALASGIGLISRESAASRSPDRWLDFDTSPGLPGLDHEARLSRLATWLYEAESLAQSHGQAYGLKLPGVTVGCQSGSAHLRACLDALALWHRVS